MLTCHNVALIFIELLNLDTFKKLEETVKCQERKNNQKELDMAKERHQIKSECPECGCGLVDGMTPDEFREKHGDIGDKDKESVSSGEHDKGDED